MYELRFGLFHQHLSGCGNRYSQCDGLGGGCVGAVDWLSEGGLCCEETV